MWALVQLAALAVAGPAVPPESKLAPAGPWSISAGASVGIGLFFATFGQGSISVGRRFRDRFDLELTFHAGAGQRLADLEGTLRAGVVLHLARPGARPVDLVLAWRIGYAAFYLQFPGGDLWTGALAASVIIEVQLPLTRRWTLRLAPLVGTGYWRGIWGFVLQPGVGVAWQF
jgi:hypothetical protein